MRPLVIRAIQRLGHIAVSMESFAAGHKPPVQTCLDDVGASDVFVGIYAWRYGYVPADPEWRGKSITELEYLHAKKMGIPTLVFMLHEDAAWPRKLMDRGAAAECIEKLRAELQRDRIVGYFHTAADLESQVTVALAHCVAHVTASAARRARGTRIFVSYRHDDSRALTGRVGDHLRSRFGDEAVFMDVDSIPIGVDFREHIAGAMRECGVLLAVIGRHWLEVQQNGKRRIDDPEDFVRVEIEAAMKLGIPVVPVLVDKTPMPQEGSLPASLTPLSYLNAVEIDSGRDFRNHMGRLIRGLEQMLDPKQAANPERRP